MKIWLIVSSIAIVIFSGCSSTNNMAKLKNQNARQALLIQQQYAQIAALKEKLDTKRRMIRKTRTRQSMPTAPKKNIKLKKVEDNNYSSGYMYPETKKKKPKKVKKVASINSAMTTAECISMIGQAKFDKYTQMFGSEAASLKRCKMLKAMK